MGQILSTSKEIEMVQGTFDHLRSDIKRGNLILYLLDKSEYMLIRHQESTGTVDPTHISPTDGQKNWNIPKDAIELKKKLGTGHFGVVWEGILNKTERVAVKILKDTEGTIADFEKEVEIMKICRHENLVKLIAVCTDQECLYIIMEFMIGGSLLECLRQQKKLDLKEKVAVAAQVANGMRFLEDNNIVHRDLAARNVLIGEGNVAKVADFGLARLVKYNEGHYCPKGKAIFPIKWTAPEAPGGGFTTKSDVWSFGILLMEVMADGEEPYQGMSTFDARKIEEGYRMERPTDCPKDIYDEAFKCWNKKPKDRPNFSSLHQFFINYKTN